MATARAVALLALAGTVVCVAGWLLPQAAASGWPGTAILLLVLAPLLLGLRGLALARLRTARWLSLLLPFYGALFLVGAVGNPDARGWVSAGAFSATLAFGAAVGWIRRGAPDARSR
ncbi:DUF2069 domain-containing protein [Thioalkalivibrio sp. XN279]|uniref:DUF2069 domain-containing protein n=1 Tax=Thioalkalivibrio sp. XN279 TaxID=2714953 RepID=UPI001F117516|nr:DUF2069 domain-containing protein [Thioalkalivibrio sp. XN279]